MSADNFEPGDECADVFLKDAAEYKVYRLLNGPHGDVGWRHRDGDHRHPGWLEYLVDIALTGILTFEIDEHQTVVYAIPAVRR